MSDFINVKLETKSLDKFYIRSSIFGCMKKYAGDFKGVLLDMGCGKMPYREFLSQNSSISEYVGLDVETALEYDSTIRPDFTWDGVTMPFDNDSFDTVIATEVLEHCPDPDRTLLEVHRVLAAQGVFFFTVPFLWNLHEVPHDEYRYTPFALRRHLQNSGFREIHIEATGGWHASMAQMLGLWVRRSPMGPGKRRLLSHFIKPIMAYLIRKDSISQRFSEGTMITGLCGVARK
jgi:SAM-dependent methyltransferase